MPAYNFRKETKLYVVHSGIRYELDIYPDLSFSQTFSETSVPVKTLHSQFDMVEEAIIVQANPANFSFTVPILLQQDMDVLIDLLVDWSTGIEATLNTADLYVVSNSEVYKLEKAVVESGIFQMTKESVILLNLSGSASKLTKFTESLPGTLFPRNTTRTFSMTTALNVTIGGVVQPSITAVSLELKNNVSWVDFATIQDSMKISDASRTMVPGGFVVSSRTLSGTVQQYITDEANTNVNKWAIGTPIRIQVGTLGRPYTLDFNLPSAVYTNRLEVQDIYIQSYDFRLNSNSVPISQIINKRTL